MAELRKARADRFHPPTTQGRQFTGAERDRELLSKVRTAVNSYTTSR